MLRKEDNDEKDDNDEEGKEEEEEQQEKLPRVPGGAQMFIPVDLTSFSSTSLQYPPSPSVLAWFFAGSEVRLWQYTQHSVATSLCARMRALIGCNQGRRYSGLEKLSSQLTQHQHSQTAFSAYVFKNIHLSRIATILPKSLFLYIKSNSYLKTIKQKSFFLLKN